MTRGRWIGVGVVVGVAALVGVAVTVISGGESEGPAREARAYFAAWERFDVEAMARLADQPEALRPAVSAMQDRLGVDGLRIVSRASQRKGDTASVPFTAEVEVPGLDKWRYDGQIDLARMEGRWRIRWAPAALHPQLADGLQFGTARSWPERAPILGHDGTPLAFNGDVTVVGLQPGRIQNQAEVENALQSLLRVRPADVRAALAQPWVRPDFFVPITEVRQEQFVTLRPQLEPIPGVFFQRGKGRLALTAGLGAHVVGSVGEVTAERLTELGPPYVVGDRVGLSGMEAAHERRLAGTPSGEVRLVDAEGRVVQVLHRVEGTAGQAVRLTLDRAVQQAAEQALADVVQPAALVAVDASSGDVRAVVSRPLSEEFNRALAGRYPPGSTFKVVTTAGLLGSGLRPEDTVACPAQVNVGGRTFVNFEGGALGNVPFTTAFAQSCNTAFVGLATRLSPEALASAARGFGFGSSYEIGLPVGGGQFPVPGDATELAAAAIGQGRVVASPIHMATVAAAVASGSWRAPRLATDAPPGEVKGLDPSVAVTLRQLMGAVVQQGTATAVAGRGTDVGGKTGTAEFGTGDPPPTHAWFIGYRGTLAFALLVEGGGVGGRVAAPLAARFLDAVPR